MKVTSAYASKILRQLKEEKEYWRGLEMQSSVYTAAVDETPVVPEYDYSEVAAKIADIDEKVRRVKHAINLANVSSTVTVNGTEMSIDTVLVKMTQLNWRKNILDSMRQRLPKTRVDHAFSRYRSANRSPEYEYVNYDLDLVKAQYEQISREIMDIQMALDRHNQTFEFEVEI
ncbi:MAG: hypothetical protein LIO67_09605 [Lachnospiraceae bacterium]|nr:hypothetical protein [Lachnospiraceae bacterium]